MALVVMIQVRSGLYLAQLPLIEHKAERVAFPSTQGLVCSDFRVYG
jgi:hypothetical protein